MKWTGIAKVASATIAGVLLSARPPPASFRRGRAGGAPNGDEIADCKERAQSILWLPLKDTVVTLD